MNRSPALASLLVFMRLCGYAGTSPPDSIVVQSAGRFLSSSKHVGLSIGIYDQGKTYTWHYGTTEKGEPAPPTNNTLYEIASLTKTFTGILLAQAVADGKIDLQTPVVHYLSGRYPNLTLNGRTVKMVDLANHTSGLPKNIPDLPGGATAADIISTHAALTPETFLAALHNIRLASVPGTVYGYSNAGAQLIGIVLEKVYRKTYQELLYDFIIRPAGMKHTWLMVPPDEKDHEAKGYNDRGEPAPQLEQMRLLPAAGYLKSDVSDMLKYIAFNANEKGNRAVKLAHHPTYMNSSPNGSDVALFWQTKYFPALPQVIQHAGGSFGTTSYLLIVPERQLGIICIANDAAVDTESQLRSMAERILSEWIK